MKKYRLKQNMTCDQEFILSDDELPPAEFFEEIKEECKHEKCTRIGDTILKPSEWIEERMRYYKKNEYATPFESALLNFLDEYFKC